MKKIIILLGLSFIFIESPKAYMISIDNNNETYTYKYEKLKFNNINKYQLTLQDDYIELKDIQMVNNLASYYNTNDLYESVVIQKLIFEEVNKDYIVKVLDDSLNIIDTSKKEQEIYSKIEEYNKKDPHDNTYYEANFDDELSLKDFPCYNAEGYSYTCETYYGYRITMNNETGLVKINLKNSISRHENYIYGKRMQYKEFSIFVNVHGRKVTFDIEPGASFIFSVYNKYRYLRDIIVNEKELTHYFKDEDLKFVDVSAGHFEKIDDFWVTKDETIKLRPEYRTIQVDFETHLVDLSLIDENEKTYNDFTIYDEYGKYITSCNSKKCIINLKVGPYYIKDNVSNLISLKFFYENKKEIIFRYIVSGIISNKAILNIKYNNEEVSFSNDNNIYFFDNIIDYKYLDIYYEDSKTRISLNDYGNYIKILDFGVFYKLPEETKKTDENPSKSDDETTNQEPSIDVKADDSKITINVPNTGVENLELILYRKEEYEKNFTINNNYITL